MRAPIDTTWWHVYPLGFLGATIRPEGGAEAAAKAPTRTLASLIPWLDYANDLGFEGLLLGPIFRSSSHGYDTLDHLAIDPRLGTEADFDALAAACAARGMHLALDGVFNHVGDRHPWVLDALANGPDSAGAKRVRIDHAADGTPSAHVFEGHGGLITLRHDAEEVRAYTAEVMTHWLERGATSWRLDAAYAVPTDFWADVLRRTRATHADAWFLAEVIHGDYAGIAAASTVDSVTQYELWKSLWSSIANRNFFELDWTLTRHLEFCEAFTPSTFVGNHDVTRIASQVGIDGAITALWLLMTLPGTPFVYYGDEVGALGVKEDRIGGDDAVRPEYPPTPPPGWATDADAARVLAAHREALELRRENPWLTRATVTVELLENTRITYVVSGANDGESLRVDADLAASPRVTVSKA
jgi:cyclomaltodextrinase / maltogenic alpha-amylase / neopullulanase